MFSAVVVFNLVVAICTLMVVYGVSPTTSFPKAEVTCASLIAHAMEQVLFDAACAQEH